MSTEEAPRERLTQTQSVARSIALMRCFVQPEGALTLSQLARRTGVNVSTAYRLLQTLCAGGMLAREAEGERYMLGPVFVALGRSALVAAGVPDARAVLETLVESTHESASLGVAEDGHVVVILRQESVELLRFDRPTGTRVPLHVSAMGKALLAFGAEPIPDAVRALGRLTASTPSSITSVRALEKDLKAAVQRGYTVVDEEQYPGLRSVGAPVLGPGGVALAAVAVQGPTSRITDDRIDALGLAVQEAARGLAALPNLALLIAASPARGSTA